MSYGYSLRKLQEQSNVAAIEQFLTAAACYQVLVEQGQPIVAERVRSQFELPRLVDLDNEQFTQFLWDRVSHLCVTVEGARYAITPPELRRKFAALRKKTQEQPELVSYVEQSFFVVIPCEQLPEAAKLAEAASESISEPLSTSSELSFFTSLRSQESESPNQLILEDTQEVLTEFQVQAKELTSESEQEATAGEIQTVSQVELEDDEVKQEKKVIDHCPLPWFDQARNKESEPEQPAITLLWEMPELEELPLPLIQGCHGAELIKDEKKVELNPVACPAA